MRVAYFINQYPKVSHSFIRREIQALEVLNVSVLRFALRTNPEELVDKFDQSELGRTHYILSAPAGDFLLALGSCLLRQPRAFLKSLFTALRLGLRSDRGVFRHLIYFVEACLLFRWLKKANVDHVHAHFGTNSTMVVMLAHLLGGPGYSFTVHGPEEFDKPEFLALKEKIEHCRFVVAISSYGRSQLFRWVPMEQWPKVKVVHCGLDEVFWDNKESQVFTVSDQLVCVGRLCEQKGQLLLLEAAKALADAGYSFSLVLAGDGPMRSELEQRIESYGLTDIVNITGWVSNEQVRELISSSRGMVLPSFAEGLPVVIMEAMALKKPVISTYVAGIPELVQHGENGWLVPAGDVEQLISAMRQLLDADDETLLAMGSKAYESVAREHHIVREVEKLAGYFREVTEMDRSDAGN
ncbi:glycosyltransferase [Methylobacter sp. Wu1]|uniref:glycosyltransferase n=1 Tax=Methylobacter sp. Wu1 TaxID=3119359 RepID=UPI002F953736